jgi:heme oxygenase-like protein
MKTPRPRGPISERLLAILGERPCEFSPVAIDEPADPLADEDLQLALYCCYELHYRGLPGVDDRWEWNPSLLGFRGTLEDMFERALLASVSAPAPPAPEDADVALRAIADGDTAPSLSQHLARSGTRGQIEEFMIHRSAYQLKEADPHSWALPRLSGGPKAALVEIQSDEYGAGDPARIHARLFADSMRSVGLDNTYGAYLNRIPGVTLATVNLMSFFGLHRRYRGAIAGHLALFEMTSSIPNGRYAAALRRLGYDVNATAFFDEHVEADAVHENIAAVDLAGGLMRAHPELAADVMFGAAALAELDKRWATHVHAAWSSGESSLLAIGPPSPAALVS